jgi:SP family general alpha glucoside:H+ symporter-like MFS transporter
VAAIFAPESPWHLTRTGQIDEAKKSISRLAYPGYYSEDDLTAQVALMQHTLAIEALEHKDQSFLNCFKGTNLRRTEIVAAVFAVQQWCGQPMTSLSTQL